jgi:PhoH-like ATPase
MKKKNYILDTSVYLTNARAIYDFGRNDIIIPLKVLEEVDKHKKRQDGVGAQARQFIRILDSLREKGSLKKGIRIETGKGMVRVCDTSAIDASLLPPDLDPSVPDHIIIATALTASKEHPDRKNIMVSRDINMRVICDSIGLVAQDYNAAKAVDDLEKLYSGFETYLVDDQTIDRFYAGDDVFADQDEVKFHPNQYLLLVSNANDKKTALARFVNYNTSLKKVIHDNLPSWGIQSRNKEQAFAIDLLMDPSVEIVSLIGKAGSGKTLCAIAAGMEQTLGANMASMKRQSKDSLYSRMIVSRPIMPMGRDIGFLPGTMEEKMHPWLMPIQDNLQFLVGNDKIMLEQYMEKGLIEIEALTYIRGRSISNAYIIIDEAQNLTAHEIKTIITRAGEGTKIVLTGDIEQIDNAYTDETSNGLAYAIEKFKYYELSGHITLQKGERSKVATLAAKIL